MAQQMRLRDRVARENTLREVLRGIDETLGDARPTAQALAILDTVRSMIAGRRCINYEARPVDYMERVQIEARNAWSNAATKAGPNAAKGTAEIATPLGLLRATTWRRPWQGKRGERVAWATVYYLDDEPVSVAEIKAAGLARRPSTRNRQKREAQAETTETPD